MSFGAQFLNESLVVQIDSTYGNYYLSRSGAAASTAISGTGTGVSSLLYPPSWLVVTVVGLNPLIAFRCSEKSFLYNVVQSGSNWTFTIVTFGLVGTLINYYIYDTYPTATGSGWGMEIYNEFTQVNFSSLRKYLRVIDQLIGTYNFVDGVSNWNGTSYSYPAGKTYALIQSHLSWGNDAFPLFGYIVGLCNRFGGDGFSLHDERINQSGRAYVEPYGDLEFVDKVAYVVVDVTGH
jgi:hypothetical protein